MKQIVQNHKSGELRVVEVPTPAQRPGGVLVRNAYSVISTGTERMKVQQARMNLLEKAKARPDQVKKVLDAASREGPLETYRKVMVLCFSWNWRNGHEESVNRPPINDPALSCPILHCSRVLETKHLAF
jgi:hypothetical protein